MVHPRKRTPTTETALPLAILAFAALSAGCASTDTSGGLIDRLRTPNEGVRAELEQLEERVRRLETEASANDTENARLRERIAELAASLEEVRAAATAAPPSTLPFEPPPPPRVRVVEVSELENDTDREDAAQTAEAVEAPETAEAIEATDGGLYDQALQAFMRNEYVEAELGFQRYLSAFPDTDLSDNALYWIGECRFARGDYRGAMAAFQQMLHDFPLGNKVPDTLLKVGRSLERLGDTDGARRRFREVSRRFPDTEAARMAAGSLAALDDR
jgi:tol-pal system protein YbgF